MIKTLLLKLIVVIPIVLSSQSAVHVPINGTIDMGLPSYIDRAIKLAETDSASLIVFDIDTFGGRVDAATKIKDLILGSRALTIAYVNRRAISAGALIALSCDSIYINSASTIGAATAVNAEGEKASEKVISYMREEMASSAEANGRSRELAEAMVDEEIVINFIVSATGDTIYAENIEGFNEGKLLTLSTDNALKLGIADREVKSISELFSLYNIKQDKVIKIEETWSELLVRFLTNPTFAPILMSIGMMGLFFEIKSPGFGIPGGIGLLSLGLFFGSHLLVGLANVTEVLFLFGGIVMILLEILVIPGFGIAGISGFLMIVYSLFKMLIGEYPLPQDLNTAMQSMSFSVISMTIISALIFRAFTRTEYYRKLIPTSGQSSAEGFSISRGFRKFVGERGITLTVLRPSGKVMIGEKTYQAMSTGDFIEKNQKIIVIDTDENQLVVKKV